VPNPASGEHDSNVTKARHRQRSFHTGALSNETLQKICRLAAIDFCCLNYKLPPVCQEVPLGNQERVLCHHFQNDDNGQEQIQPVLV